MIQKVSAKEKRTRERTKQREASVKLARRLAHEMLDEAGSRHGMSDTPEWAAYKDARKRCRNPHDKDFKHYGGRGIQFLFKSFREWFWAAGPRPSAMYSIDRIDNDGPYASWNIRWATRSQQQRNKRKPQRKTT